MARQNSSIFSRELALAAVRDSFPKLDPRLQFKNPVMFIVEIGSVITTVNFFLLLARGHTGQLWFVGTIAVWLWLTVLFANFAEAIAEGRGKAQANALRATRTTTTAFRQLEGGALEEVAAPDLRKGDIVGGHGRYAAALGPARDRSDAGARAVVPRPHDRPRGGGRAAQDPE